MTRLIAAQQRIIILVAGLMVASAAPVAAQRYHVQTYTEGEGLPSSTVRGIAQGPSGRMWFATRAGVAVYDGRDWQTFGSSDGLVPTDRRLLVFDEEGTPWAAAAAGSDVARFDGKRWVSLARPDLPAGCHLTSMIVEHGGQAARVVLGTSCGLRVWESGDWCSFGFEHGLPDERVTSLARGNDEILVGTLAGLAALSPGEERLARPALALPEGPVLGLARHDRGSVWVIGPGWIGRITRDSFESLAQDVDMRLEGRPVVATPDGTGGVFFGDLASLYQYHPERGLQRLDERNGLIAGGVEEVLLDREGNLWAATRRGVSKIVSFRFATYRADHGLFEEEVTAILEMESGGMVFGHRSGLTFSAGPGFRTLEFQRAKHLESERVLDLAETRQELWIAGNAFGLGRLAAGELTWSHPLEGARVHSVLVDDQGALWVAAGPEVMVDRGGGFETMLRLPEGVGARRVVTGRGDSVYALTSGAGLYRIRSGGTEHWTDPQRPDLNNLYALLERDDGELWAGSASGLVVAREGTLRKTSPPMPVVERPVYFIVADGEDFTWFGTDNGVLRWDGERLEHYTVEDGLGGRETNRAAGLIDSSGRLWIGTTHGATVYRSELDRRVPVPPALSALELEASGEAVSLADEVRLGPGGNDLAFSFRAIYFSDERRILLRSWLEGFETDWSSGYTSADQRVRYTNLPPGRYRFHVEAGNRDGLWSETISSPEILIAAPVWRRTWFWVLVVVAAAAVLYVAQRHVNQARYARRLEAEVKRRVKELHRAEVELARAQRLEALGLLAGGIGHDFNNLLMAIRGSLAMLGENDAGAAREWIARADSAVERARELTAQLVTFSRGGAPVRSAARVADVIHDSASFVLRGQTLRCEIDLPSDLRVVEIDAGQINQVVNNLLLNAVQAMPTGGRVQITGRNVDDPTSLLAPGKYVEIAVRDEGAGIAEHDRHRIFDPYFSTKEGGAGLGLATAYSIVRRHGGLLTVESPPDRGATFRIYLPASEGDVEPAPPEPGITSFDGTRILVMDDEPSVCEVIAGLLQSLGCSVTETSNGEEAVRRYKEALSERRRFDAVIFDLTVPGAMGGEEAIRHLLDADPDARAIVASGYFNAPVMSDYRAHGFRAVLKKPFRLEELAAALRQVLEIPVES